MNDKYLLSQNGLSDKMRGFIYIDVWDTVFEGTKTVVYTTAWTPVPLEGMSEIDNAGRTVTEYIMYIDVGRREPGVTIYNVIKCKKSRVKNI